MPKAPPAAAAAAAGPSAASPRRTPAPTSSLQQPSSSAHTPHGPATVSAAAEAAAPLASGPTYTFPLPAGLDLTHLHIVLTGGTSGVGLEAAKVLCAKNAHVYLVGDDLGNGRRALREVQEAVPKAAVDFFECDIGSLRSVRTFAEAFKALGVPLHVLALNAGSFLWPYRKTPDGCERTIATNYLGHFYLAHLLLPELRAATPSRIVWQASAFEQLGLLNWGGDFARDSDLWQYANSKLMAVMAAREMARHLKGSGVDVFACHPGLVSTPLYDRTSSDRPGSWLFTAAARLFGQSAARGAASLIYTAAAPELDGKEGGYYGPPYVGPLSANILNCSPLTPLNPRAHSADSCRRLYEETAHLLEQKTGQRPLPNKLPATYREHGWQEDGTGRDSARPVDAALQPSSPRAGTAYRAHEAAAHLKQAPRGSGVGVPASKVVGAGPGPSAGTAAAAAALKEE
ncbi:WW domain-containing oxidoreductase isoform X1 [Chlorella sorokiniana]|uniref:WW domain-containing oxidoreductase isoform X1 n=1 Tax=Chlorella sorokiniana TaxID=3076 RepID=A0A2P6TGA9_CHLSO|nr:WW domain-containing oxidoreductase isoform X1 [Chlorella sorokiniana]|eukprot:PRW33149.1 WW domain-containing oxidoreductase isoform X1 [Chlorella sorokiniana]